MSKKPKKPSIPAISPDAWERAMSGPPAYAEEPVSQSEATPIIPLKVVRTIGRVVMEGDYPLYLEKTPWLMLNMLIATRYAEGPSVKRFLRDDAELADLNRRGTRISYDGFKPEIMEVPFFLGRVPFTTSGVYNSDRIRLGMELDEVVESKLAAEYQYFNGSKTFGDKMYPAVGRLHPQATSDAASKVEQLLNAQLAGKELALSSLAAITFLVRA